MLCYVFPQWEEDLQAENNWIFQPTVFLHQRSYLRSICLSFATSALGYTPDTLASRQLENLLYTFSFRSNPTDAVRKKTSQPRIEMLRLRGCWGSCASSSIKKTRGLIARKEHQVCSCYRYLPVARKTQLRFDTRCHRPAYTSHNSEEKDVIRQAGTDTDWYTSAPRLDWLRLSLDLQVLVPPVPLLSSTTVTIYASFKPRVLSCDIAKPFPPDLWGYMHRFGHHPESLVYNPLKLAKSLSARPCEVLCIDLAIKDRNAKLRASCS